MNLKNCKLSIVIDFFMLTAGAILAAFAIEEFLVPSTILDGGMIGVSIMINNLTSLPLSVLTIIFNVPFLIVGAKKMGVTFIVKSAYAMVIFSVFLEVFGSWINATDELLLAVSFGGVILGAGVGLVIRFGGCLDGTETVAIMLNRKFKWPVGRTVLIFNIAIYVLAGFLFGFDRAMYSLLTYFITSKVLDIVEVGLEEAKAAMIITDEGLEVAEKIYQQMGRTVTMLEGEGLISGKKVVLYCVLTKFEIYELKRVINNIDASAFVAVSDVSEIIGNHIKKNALEDESCIRNPQGK
ncbi:Uncharacterized BCR%2C YitT family COG1284 [uncultured Roseburia sp.]|uniref:YitT family protein n=1 Tax=Brotonthovivens ammoniilytica TaxID=2981725 RepID=A0ABT2TNK3_9FIRM|nr:YitT family protein [Brotonthovivens ammoniilytica]MCU6763276.1 YitT family protein [Brotonthovivens ammoniilytica]SCJ11715.1 Uncharacterized BCR%2C YitT family COG1284 [uncultured Roseburia sp.]